MIAPKAIFKVGTIGNVFAKSRYESKPKGQSSRPEYDRPQGRCEGKIEGDLKGFGFVSDDPISNASALQMAAGKGKIRSGLLTCQPIADPIERARVAKLLPEEIRQKMATLFPHSPYVVDPRHLDTLAPHCAFSFVPLDAQGKPLRVRPEHLAQLQVFGPDSGLVSGKGSVEFHRKALPPDQVPKWEKNTNSKALCRATGTPRERAMLAKLERLLAKGESMETLKKNHGFGSNIRTKAGGLLKRPSITMDGVTVRLRRLPELGFPGLAARLQVVIPAPVAPNVLPTKLLVPSPRILAERALTMAREKTKKDQAMAREKEKEDRMKKGIDRVGKKLGSELLRRVFRPVLPTSPAAKIVKLAKEIE